MHADYKPAEDLLDDRVILVTGAGDGIGRAAAKAFAYHGATVILLGKTVAKLEAVYDEIEAAGGPEPAIYPMHLEGATPHEYDEMAHVIDINFGQLDGILHNAANLPYLSRIKDYDAEDWIKVMQVNVNAQFLLTRHMLPLLQAAPAASIVFTSSGVGRKGRAYWGAYAVAKAGIENLSQTLVDELEDRSPSNRDARRRRGHQRRCPQTAFEVRTQRGDWRVCSGHRLSPGRSPSLHLDRQSQLRRNDAPNC